MSKKNRVRGSMSGTKSKPISNKNKWISGKSKIELNKGNSVSGDPAIILPEDETRCSVFECNEKEDIKRGRVIRNDTQEVYEVNLCKNHRNSDLCEKINPNMPYIKI